MDRGAWQATVHWVTKSWTRLSDSHSLHNVRKAYLFSNKGKRSERVVVVDGGRGTSDKCGVLCHPTLKVHLKSWVSETQLSVQFSHSVVSDSLRPRESQHTSPPRPSPTPGVYSNSCPSSRWRHPAISSSVVPFSSCPQSLPASRSFPMSQLFTWDGQSIGVSASVSVLPMNTLDWSPLGTRTK